MNRRWLWIALPLLGVLVAVENFLFFANGSARLQEAPDEADEALELALDEDASREPLQALEESDLMQWLASIPLDRNPFWRASEAQANGVGAGEAALRVAGTLVGSTRSVAWIGGVPHSVGDRVDDRVIVDITARGVVLARDGEPVFLEIASPARHAESEEIFDDAKLD